jgi:poly-gamma-glutamate capsule biosynthesis protein CapA/YwtB (metallophosphatase superfamily)
VTSKPLTVFLCGDVMLGRGVDQILPHPGDPSLRESYVTDARSYVALAEAVNGPIARPVDFSWPWGEALSVLEEAGTDVRVINLETTITRAGTFAPGKPVHYRMSPDNLRSLTVARPDACALANNHVLDFGIPGLCDTLDALTSAGLRPVGAGRDVEQARRPVTIDVAGTGRVVIFSCGMESSGIPPSWAATAERPGVDFIPRLSDSCARELAERMCASKQPGDVVVASLHWGSNWGYHIPPAQTRFAHRLIDGGVDIIHGHSSHHPRPIELYRNKLILYGCGDLINDYEGIRGHAGYRDDLRLLYFATVTPENGVLTGLRMVPMQARQLRLQHASPADSKWLCGVLDQVSAGFGTRVSLSPQGLLVRPARDDRWPAGSTR